MAVILKAMPFRASGRKRQHRVFAIERLDGRLLIGAEDRRMLRRMQIQTNDIGGFGLKVWIIRGHVAFQPMWPQGMLAPHPRHHHVTETQAGGEFARAPMGRAITGLALHAPLQNARLQRRRELARQLPGVAAKQPGQAFRHKALAPARDKAVGAIQLRPNRGPGVTAAQQQDQARTPRLIGAPGLTVGALGEFLVFHRTQPNRVAHA